LKEEVMISDINKSDIVGMSNDKIEVAELPVKAIESEFHSTVFSPDCDEFSLIFFCMNYFWSIDVDTFEILIL
jgi:hypothetical protein